MVLWYTCPIEEEKTMKRTTFVDLYTKEGEELLFQRTIDPDYQPWNEYPRPQLRRDNWMNLNGLWEFQESTGRCGWNTSFLERT